MVQNAMPDLLIVIASIVIAKMMRLAMGSQGNSWREASITLGRVMGADLFDYPVTFR